MPHFLPDTSKDHNGDRKSDRRRETVHDPCQNTVVLLYIGKRHTQHCTVGRDQRKIHTQGLVQSRNEFLQEHLHELHQSRYDKDKNNGLQIRDIERQQNILIDCSRHRRGQSDDEDDRHTHTGSRIGLLGYSQERT